MTKSPDNSASKQRRGWQPGQSGNPAGKPRGARNHATRLLEALMSEQAEAVVQAVIDAARGGDIAAARLILERLVPVRKGRPVALDLPPLHTAADARAALGATIDAMAAGELSPEEAATIAGVVDAARKAIETEDLAAEIERLKLHVGLDPAA